MKVKEHSHLRGQNGCLGFFYGLDALLSAYPEGGLPGEFFINGKTQSIWVWDATGRSWYDSNHAAPAPFFDVITDPATFSPGVESGVSACFIYIAGRAGSYQFPALKGSSTLTVTTTSAAVIALVWNGTSWRDYVTPLSLENVVPPNYMYRGAWSETLTYIYADGIVDVVYYQGRYYRVKQEGSITGEVPDQSTPEGPALARKMIDLCHELDPTRLVTSGNDRIAADNEPATEEFLAEFSDDIVGYNYPDRWRTRRETYYTTDKLRWPDRRVVATEAGGMGGSRVPASGFSRRFTQQQAPAAASYIDTEQRWKYTLINDFVIGDFMWTGIDYYGETRWPSRGASSGYLDNCGFKKDGYWFFKSIWSDEPVLHLAKGWNYGNSRIGQIIQVVVFTNCTEVELFVNGRSYGVKTREFPRRGNVNQWNQRPEGKVNTSTADLHLSWDVEYQPGELKLVGTKDGREYVEVFRTAGAPAAVRASFDRSTISTDPGDVAHLTVEIVDAAGNVVPSADNLVKFSAPGARIIGVESGNMADLSSTKASERKAYGGMCLAIIQADKAGEYEVTVSVEGLEPQTLTLTAE